MGGEETSNLFINNSKKEVGDVNERYLHICQSTYELINYSYLNYVS